MAKYGNFNCNPGHCQSTTQLDISGRLGYKTAKNYSSKEERMSIFDDKIKKELGEILQTLKKGITLKYFSQELECRYCKDTHDLLDELTGFSDKIKLEVYDFVKDKDIVDNYSIDKIPAIVVEDGTDYGIRFFGIPGGYEFASLIEAIRLVSAGDTTLKAETKTFLDNLESDVHLQVFVTPTCPYCPGSVILGHQMAHYSPRVKSDMIEATEFPHLAQKYQVMGVPRTVINETVFLEGAAPEEGLVEKIKEAL